MLFDSFFDPKAFVRKSRPIKLSTFHTCIVHYTQNVMKTIKPQELKFRTPQSVFNTNC